MYSELNQKKGTSRDKIDTTGHGEAKHRKTLMNYEANLVNPNSEELAAAMKGLFDGRSTDKMWELHKRFLQTAYPKAYAAVYPGDSSSATASSSASMAAASSSSSSVSVTSGERQISPLAVYFHTYPFPLNAITGLLPESEEERGGLLSAAGKMEEEQQQDNEEE